MSSETITRNDLTAILNEVLPPTPSEYKKLLWTNPSPTTAFSAQTVALDLSSYDEVEVWFNCWRDRPNTSQQIRVKKGTYAIATQGASTNTSSGINPFVVGSYIIVQDRPIYVTDTGVQFGTCTEGASNGTMYNADGSMIPAYIYGIKFERVAPPQLEADIETLATDITIIRVGNLRVLKCKSAVYSTIKSITLATSDRPSTTIEFTGIKHAGGMYATLGLGYIETTGKITAVHWGAYSGSAYPSNLVNSDNFTGDAIWYVTE